MSLSKGEGLSKLFETEIKLSKNESFVKYERVREVPFEADYKVNKMAVLFTWREAKPVFSGVKPLFTKSLIGDTLIVYHDF